MIIETKRLILREMTQDDFSSLALILQDSEVMKAYEHPFSNQEVQDWLDKQLKRYLEDGFGLWAVINKEDNELIGQCGLTYQTVNELQVVEIGYLFQKAYWHQGYAIEATRACKEYAFKQGIDEVYSIIRDNNIPSQKVAERNGLTYKYSINKHYYGLDMNHLVYSIKRNV